LIQDNPAPATSNLALQIPRANVIAINDVGIDPESDIAQMLRKADKDNDGNLDMAEITAVFQELNRKQSQVRMLSYLLISQFALLLLFAGVSFGLVWVVVDYHSNPVKNGIMVDRKSGNPIQVCSATGLMLQILMRLGQLTGCLVQVENAVMTVNNGVLVSRNASSITDSAVQVSVQETVSAELNSYWDTADLLQVKDITLSDETSKGSFLSAKVTGVVRVFDTHGVGVVLFETALGRFILQDSNILPAEDFEGGILANVTAADIVNGRLGTHSNRETRPAGRAYFKHCIRLTPCKGRSGQVHLGLEINQNACQVVGESKSIVRCAENEQGRLLPRHISLQQPTPRRDLRLQLHQFLSEHTVQPDAGDVEVCRCGLQVKQLVGLDGGTAARPYGPASRFFRFQVLAPCGNECTTAAACTWLKRPLHCWH
jgi:hypothetical protein